MTNPIPACLGPVTATSAPRSRIPSGAWDTHFHILGPQARFPYAPTRKYTPPDATLDACFRAHDTLGIERGWVVHANTHGFDNRVDLDAVERAGGRYVAVVRLDASATVDSCRALHRSGARGVRFAFNPQHGGTLNLDAFNHVLRCIEPLGWFVELHFAGEALPDLHGWLRSIPTTIVIDHFGRIDPALGLDQRPFELLCDLAARETVWIKFSGADRITRSGPPYADVVPFAHRLAEIAPDRIVWGSDWPHTGIFDAARMPDDGVLLDALEAFVPDEALRHRILVDNPRRLTEG